MSGIKTIKEIERQYNVEDISFKGLYLWPILRYYICVKKTTNKTSVTVSGSSFYNLIRTFFYGFKYYFKKNEFLIMSSVDQRKRMGDKMIDKSIDPIASKLNKAWIIELSTSTHYRRSELINKTVSSKLPLLLFTRLYAKFFIHSSKIENKEVLDNILRELNVDIDVLELCKRHYAQYRVMKYLAKRKKWKAAYIVCHYTNMGYIKALREMSIPVIEIQHGLIAKSHCAYNLFSDADTSFYPNYLLSFGSAEKQIFNNGNRFIDPLNVIPVGHSYVEYLSNHYHGNDQLKKKISSFKHSIAVVSQDHPVEKKLIDFIRKAALKNTDTIFIFIPRNYTKIPKKYDFPENVILFPELNVYELLWHVDIHATVFSTVAIEAPAMGKPNILINIDNLSKKFLDDFLTENQINKYVESTADFHQSISQLSTISKQEVIDLYGPIIKPGYDGNIETFLNEYIKQN